MVRAEGWLDENAKKRLAQIDSAPARAMASSSKHDEVAESSSQSALREHSPLGHPMEPHVPQAGAKYNHFNGDFLEHHGQQSRSRQQTSSAQHANDRKTIPNLRAAPLSAEHEAHDSHKTLQFAQDQHEASPRHHEHDRLLGSEGDRQASDHAPKEHASARARHDQSTVPQQRTEAEAAGANVGNPPHQDPAPGCVSPKICTKNKYGPQLASAVGGAAIVGGPTVAVAYFQGKTQRQAAAGNSTQQSGGGYAPANAASNGAGGNRG